MRIFFPNLTLPKKAAKVLSVHLHRPLSLCQAAIAQACGYRDYHELEVLASQSSPSALDHMLSKEEYVARQVHLSLRIAECLGVDHGDVQAALVVAHLTGSRAPNLAEQLDVRIACYRQTCLPPAGRRERGSVGKVKAAGWHGEQVILKSFGRACHVITQQAPNALVADFEYIAPRQSLPLFVPMRLYLAYGVWTESDGTKVIFSRDYCPMWRLQRDQKPTRPYPWEKIRFTKEEHFWSDGGIPWRIQRRYDHEMHRLSQFGIATLPRLVEALPLLVLRDDIRHTLDAVHELRRLYELIGAA